VNVSAQTSALTDQQWTSVLALAESQAATLKVEDLADHAAYSPFHFTRLFTIRMGMGPGQYLTALRIDAAKNLLLADDDPVIDVATEVGFDSLSSFTRRFSSTVGVSPGKLRELEHRVGDSSLRPFALSGGDASHVRVRLVLPEDVSPRADPSVWIGWFPRPTPVGLPRAGMLVCGRDVVDLPLCPGAPFLLGFAVAADAGPREQLAPSAPVVAAHPAPLTEPGEVTLLFGTQDAGRRLPMLPALPSLYRW
jgi:AraC family transcriptional regulator